jgi:alpha-mannosidase
MKFALEHQNPLVSGWIRADGVYPEQTFSLLSVSNSHVLLWSLKPAEDGIAAGLVARFWNLSPKGQDLTVSLSTGLSAARRVTHIETDIAGLPLASGRVATRIEGSQLQTMRLVPQKNGGN